MTGIEFVEEFNLGIENGFSLGELVSIVFADAIGLQFNVASAVEVLAVIATACVGLAFMWWGVRKVTRALMSAFKKGKISL